MVGGGSPNALHAVQQRIIQNVLVNYFNSTDHDNTLTNVAAHKGVCLSPGFLNDYSGQFAWIPFDCEENFPCVLCTHSGALISWFLHPISSSRITRLFP